MGKWTLWALALALVVVSCTEDQSESATTSVTEAARPSDPGRLVILDASGDIVVMGPDGSNRQAITDNAGESALYTQPIWSPDASTLAWGQVTESGFAVGIQEPGADATTMETSNLPFYMYWSPDGRNLGVLNNGTTGVEFRIVDVDRATSTSLDEDSPFYFSWSPEGERVVTHAGESRAETISPDGDRVSLEPTAGTYLAPQWTANGVFHVVDDELVLEDLDGERVPVAAVSGLTMFVSNPQGTVVALQTTGDGSAISVSTEDFPTLGSESVVVVDVATHDVEVVSDDLALGFFWSPNGGSLLVLTTADNRVVPGVWTTGGDLTDFTAYQPPGTMLQDTFPFFPQYAQSVSFWAPDSSAFAFAGEIDGERGIWIQELDGETPTRVSDGAWVAWSPSTTG